MSKHDTKLTPQILAMYLGCRVIDRKGNTATLTTVDRMGLVDLLYDDRTCMGDSVKYIKPILRRLSSMTTEESHWWSARKQRKGFMAQVHADNTLWLCSKSFDLFGLIDAGLAIDAKTIEVNQQTPKP